MRKSRATIAIIALVVSGLSTAMAHQATELYIPLGRSPGISDGVSDIGQITQVDAQGRTITVTHPAGTRTVSITDSTNIYLDRTMLKRSNAKGSFGDLKLGRRVEVKYVDPGDRQSAEWVKVQITAP